MCILWLVFKIDIYKVLKKDANIVGAARLLKSVHYNAT